MIKKTNDYNCFNNKFDAIRLLVMITCIFWYSLYFNSPEIKQLISKKNEIFHGRGNSLRKKGRGLIPWTL